MTLNEISDALGFKDESARDKADQSVYGKVMGINSDGSFEVAINGSDTTVTCAKMSGARVGDTVLVTIFTNGYTAVTGCVGGDRDAEDAQADINLQKAHFWYDQYGAHVQADEDERNVLVGADGVYIRNGSHNDAQVTSNGMRVFNSDGDAIAAFEATTYIGRSKEAGDTYIRALPGEIDIRQGYTKDGAVTFDNLAIFSADTMRLGRARVENDKWIIVDPTYGLRIRHYNDVDGTLTAHTDCQITANGMTLYRDGSAVAQFGTSTSQTIILGRSNTTGDIYTRVYPTGFDIRRWNGSAGETLASFGANTITLGKTTGTLGNVQIGTSGMVIKNGGTTVGSFLGDTITLGKTTGGNVQVTSTGLVIRRGSTDIAEFSANGLAVANGNIILANTSFSVGATASNLVVGTSGLGLEIIKPTGSSNFNVRLNGVGGRVEITNDRINLSGNVYATALYENNKRVLTGATGSNVMTIGSYKIAWGSVTVSTESATGSGTFTSPYVADATITFGTTFGATPLLYATLQGQWTGSRWVTTHSATTTTGSIRLYSSHKNTTVATIRWLAIGSA